MQDATPAQKQLGILGTIHGQGGVMGMVPRPLIEMAGVSSLISYSEKKKRELIHYLSANLVTKVFA